MSKTKIEWADRVWNPVTGCTKVSQGCKHCYAEIFYERFHGHGSFKNVQCHQDRLSMPKSWKDPSVVFVNSMSDLFHEEVPFLFINAVFSVMSDIDHHKYLILTKRPERMVEFWKWKKDQFGIPWQPKSNVWMGVSIEDQKTAEQRIPLLLNIDTPIRFLSCEPLLGPLDISSWLYPKELIGMEVSNLEETEFSLLKNGIHWVIAGGESGPGARPMHPDWARSLRDQCAAADVPFFFKQWGEWISEDQIDQEINCKKSSKRLISLSTGQLVQQARVGKKNAGRLLDGKLYDGYPL
jgi:protein gp37